MVIIFIDCNDQILNKPLISNGKCERSVISLIFKLREKYPLRAIDAKDT